MIGIERVWNSVKGRGTSAPAPGASVPRDLKALRAGSGDTSSSLAEALPNETRAAKRFVPVRTATVLTSATGKRIAARIINISRTGVAIEAELTDCGPGDIVTVGTRPVTPGRRIALGMVFMFKKPLDPKLCDPSIIL